MFECPKIMKQAKRRTAASFEASMGPSSCASSPLCGRSVAEVFLGTVSLLISCRTWIVLDTNELGLEFECCERELSTRMARCGNVGDAHRTASEIANMQMCLCPILRGHIHQGNSTVADECRLQDSQGINLP